MRALEFVTESSKPKQRVDEVVWFAAAGGVLGTIWLMVRIGLTVLTFAELYSIAQKINLFKGATSSEEEIWWDKLSAGDIIILCLVGVGFSYTLAVKTYNQAIKGTWVADNILSIWNRKARLEKTLRLAQETSWKATLGKDVRGGLWLGVLATATTVALTSTGFGAFYLYGNLKVEYDQLVEPYLPFFQRIWGVPVPTPEQFWWIYSQMDTGARLMTIVALWAAILGVGWAGKRIKQLWIALRGRDKLIVKIKDELDAMAPKKIKNSRKEPVIKGVDDAEADDILNALKKPTNKVEPKITIPTVETIGAKSVDDITVALKQPKQFEYTGYGFTHLPTQTQGKTMEEVVKKVEQLAQAQTKTAKKIDDLADKIPPIKTPSDITSNPNKAIQDIANATKTKVPKKSPIVGPNGQTLYVTDNGQIVDKAGNVMRNLQGNTKK